MVYDVTDYLDDHPGGEEVLIDVAGQDADEFFEDIGHSPDARDALKGLIVGRLKIDEVEIARRRAEAEAALLKGEGGASMVVIVIAILAVVIGLYMTQT